jgi:hypothetical protein
VQDRRPSRARATSHENDQAFAILEPIFAELRSRFVDRGLEELRRTRLSMDPSIHDTPRHFAATRDDGLLVYFAPSLTNLPNDIVFGIIGHELGHAADFSKPARFALDDEGRLLIRPDDADVDWPTLVKRWSARDEDAIERSADAIASWVLGTAIGYRGPCLLQSLSGGVPRPAGLR